jgi:hypothetical protein
MAHVPISTQNGRSRKPPARLAQAGAEKGAREALEAQSMLAAVDVKRFADDQARRCNKGGGDTQSSND